MKMTKELIAFATAGVMILTACDMRGLQVPPVPAQAGVAVGGSATPAPAAQTAPANNAEQASWMELTQRLVSPYFGYGPDNQPPPTPEILLGKMPPLFPAELPLPEGGRVLGGVTRGKLGAELVVDAPQAPDVVINGLRQRLEKQGWTVPKANYQPGGFAVAQNANVALCKSDKGPVMSINAQKLNSGSTDVRYSINTIESFPGTLYGPCSLPPSPSMPQFPPQLPAMIAPEGTTQFGMGSSGSQDSVSQYVKVETALSVPELRAHYDAQLTQGQWALRDKGGDDTLAWSRWLLKNEKGESQTGFMFVMDQTEDKADAKPVRYVYLQVSWGQPSGAASAPTVNVLMRSAP